MLIRLFQQATTSCGSLQSVTQAHARQSASTRKELSIGKQPDAIVVERNHGCGGWTLTSLQQRVVKTGGRLVKHARYYWLLLAESHLTRRLFASMVRRTELLPLPGGWNDRRGKGISDAIVGAEKCRRHQSTEGWFRPAAASGEPKLAPCAVSRETERP
jgi:hypothetical protein